TLRLIELAIKGGGPDNITCIVADVIDSRNSRVPPTWQPVFAGAAASGAQADLPRRPGRVFRRPGPRGYAGPSCSR
ncbi:MAG: Stp1/IreP family PP2C-type Ser/Thr phosphatase, partial [Trebonia sp.]